MLKLLKNFSFPFVLTLTFSRKSIIFQNAFFYKNISFSEILNSLSYGRLFALHPEFHAMPLKEASDLIDSRLSRRRAASTKLQAYRKRFGLSQRELSEASGVNIRTLQQYETGGKDINRAAVEKMISLSRILHCRSERLLD